MPVNPTAVNIKGRLPAGAWGDQMAAHIGDRLQALERALAGLRAQFTSPQHDPTTPAEGASGPPAVLPYHTHHADEILATPYNDVAAPRAGGAIRELSDEKLARDGSQTMLGALDMNHNSIANALNVEVEGDVGMSGHGEIDGPANVDFYTSAAPGAQVGRLHYSTTEKTLVTYVTSGA